MNKFKRLILTVFVLFFFSPVTFGECYTTNNYKAVPVYFGEIKLPAEAYIYDFDIKGNIEKMTSEQKAEFENSEIMRDILDFYGKTNMYQVVINNNNRYYNSLLITTFLENELVPVKSFDEYGNAIKEENPKMERLSNFTLTPDIITQVINAQVVMRGYLDQYVRETNKAIDKKKVYKINSTFIDNPNLLMNNPTGLLFYDFPQLERYNINNDIGIKFKMRAVAVVFGLLMDGYIDGYVFNVQDKGAAIVLLYSPDNEREFWQDVFKSSIEQGIK